VVVRLKKVSNGNLGDVKSVGGKVYELRFTEGPGWRVYVAQTAKVIYVLGGGMKRGQQGDIEAAIEFWSENGD
jgi:putative addiction module killer protein